MTRIEDLPGQLVSRKGALTTTQKRDIGDSVAIDWAASTGGRFT